MQNRENREEQQSKMIDVTRKKIEERQHTADGLKFEVECRRFQKKMERQKRVSENKDRREEIARKELLEKRYATDANVRIYTSQ